MRDMVGPEVVAGAKYRGLSPIQSDQDAVPTVQQLKDTSEHTTCSPRSLHSL